MSPSLGWGECNMCGYSCRFGVSRCFWVYWAWLFRAGGLVPMEQPESLLPFDFNLPFSFAALFLMWMKHQEAALSTVCWTKRHCPLQSPHCSILQEGFDALTINYEKKVVFMAKWKFPPLHWGLDLNWESWGEVKNRTLPSCWPCNWGE